MPETSIRVAQIRGNGLSDRETKTWEYFPSDINQTVFTTHKNIYYQSSLPFPMVKVWASTDNILLRHGLKYALGRYQQLFGLENKLNNFDIAHTGEIYNYYTYQAVQAKKRNKKLKVVATVWENIFGRFEYNYWPGFSMPPRYWRQALGRIMKENIDGVDMFLPATQDAAELLMDYGVPAERITVVTPGIIPTNSDAKSALPPAFLGKEVYLMVNRLVKEKGVYEILYGWRLYLRKAGNPANKVLAIVGDGPERQNMERLVREWNLGQHIIFTRQVPYQEMLGLYKGAICLILGSMPLPSWQEQFGYVLAEAICADVPIIAASSGAIPEVVGKSGLLVPPAHPIALSQALVRLEDPAVYQMLKQGCTAEKKKFDIYTYADKVSSIYRSLVHV
ncbi:MAG TPA: glycosyltransferase family 4 protein [Candidatus Kapabacteria bacterium]|nr:glycosyltransferase family 4 protein [Candidatus Kapabacteria bacterium]